MAITKDQWSEIEREFSGLLGIVKFRLDQRDITVTKEQISESGLGYAVYIDEKIKFTWGDPNGKDFNPLTRKLWHKKTRSLFSAKKKKELSKGFTKREVKKYMPDLDAKFETYSPFFTKLSVLKRQFQKITDLELEQIGIYNV